MAKETSKKRPARPFQGAKDGKPFTKDNQPPPEAKSAGWQRVRAERHFTKEILRQMGLIDGDGKPFVEYIRQVRQLAEEGNTEAMKQIRQAIEDDVKLIDVTTKGESIKSVVKWGDKDIPV